MKKIGIIGTGYIGESHAESWSQIKDVKIYGVCDNDKVKASTFAEKYNSLAFSDLNALLDSGIDALDICVPTQFHCSTVINALNRNIPVLCEKPMALNFSDAETMVKIADEKEQLFMIAHCVRFDPNYAYLKQTIDNQEYGKLKSIRLFRDTSIPLYSESQWLLDSSLSGGISMDFHVHDVDLIYWFLGKPDWVFTRNNPASITTLYGYEEIVASTEASWRTQKNFPFNAGYDVQFEHASLSLNNGTLKLYTNNNEKVLNALDTLPSSNIINSPNIYSNEILYFYNCLSNQTKPNYCLPSDSLNAHNLLMHEIESGTSGNKVNLTNRGN